MDIICGMTTDAGCGQAYLPVNLRRMTSVALQSLMRPGQGIAGLLGMIEFPAFPSDGRVTMTALQPQPAFVPSIVVAGIAGLRCVLELP
jgi:hypothetical protein